MLIACPSGRRAGFTLIELMIALVIIAITIVLAAPSFGIWLQNSQVRTVAESVQNGLQTARNEALRRNMNVEFAMNADTSWTVTAKVPDPVSKTITDQVIEKRTAGEGASSKVTATLTGSSATAAFNGLGRLDNANPLTRVDIASSVTGTKAMAVQISTGGQIRLCDPAVTANTDARKCL